MHKRKKRRRRKKDEHPTSKIIHNRIFSKYYFPWLHDIHALCLHSQTHNLFWGAIYTLMKVIQLLFVKRLIPWLKSQILSLAVEILHSQDSSNVDTFFLTAAHFSPFSIYISLLVRIQKKKEKKMLYFHLQFAAAFPSA